MVDNFKKEGMTRMNLRNNSNSRRKYAAPLVVLFTTIFCIGVINHQLSLVKETKRRTILDRKAEEITANYTSNFPEVEYLNSEDELKQHQKWDFPSVPGFGGLPNFLMGNVGFGALLGFSTGYALKLFGEVFMLLLGSQVLIIQILAREQVLIVNWIRIQQDLTPKLGRFGIPGLKDMLNFNMPFATSFGAGFLVGFQWE